MGFLLLFLGLKLLQLLPDGGSRTTNSSLVFALRVAENLWKKICYKDYREISKLGLMTHGVSMQISTYFKMLNGSHFLQV